VDRNSANHDCPSQDALVLFLDDTLPPESVPAVSNHVDSCAQCQKVLKRLTGTPERLLPILNESEADQIAVGESPSWRPLLERIYRLHGDGSVETKDEAASSSQLGPTLDPPEQYSEVQHLGPYRILNVLGTGGMGIVYKAKDVKLQRIVALKAMKPQIAGTANAGKRFLREARAMASIKHDHVATIYQVDEVGGVPYLAMEFLEGESLDQCIRRDGKLSLTEVLRIGREIAEGLTAVHAIGVIHRDVKPGNVWLEARGDTSVRVKLLDFGLARSESAEESRVTNLGVVVGTPEFMAPEQGRGGKVDAPADLFSLGCVLYLMATGRLPFAGPDAVSTLMAVATDIPTPPILIDCALPRDFSHLVMKLLEKDPANRFRTAQEVVQALQGIEKQVELSMITTKTAESVYALPRGRGASAAVQQGRTSPLESTALRRRRLWPLIAVSVVAVAILATVSATIVLYWQTADGMVRIEIDDPLIHVTFDQGGPVVKGADKHEIKIAAGEHGLRIRRGDLEFDTDKFILKKGQTITLRVEWFKDGKLQVVQSDKVIGAVGEIRRFEGHTEGAISVVLSSDGQRALSAGSDRTVRIWDVNTLSELKRFKGHLAGVESATFSRDESQVLSSSDDGTVRLWDAKTEKELKCFRGHTGLMKRAVLSVDGRYVLSTSDDKTMRLWEVATAKQLKCFDGHKAGAVGAAFSLDGSKALSSSQDAHIRLWNIASSELELEFIGHGGTVSAASFSPDGRHVLSSSHDGTIRLWDAKTGHELHCFNGHTRAVQSVVYSPRGRYALSGSSDRTMRLWDMSSKTEVYAFKGHTDDVLGVAFSADLRLAASASMDGTVRVWRLPKLVSESP